MFAMRRTKEEAAVTREKLLATALIVFGERGYAGTSLEDIAEAAGVTKGSIFPHFGSKAGIYTTLVAESSRRYVDLLREICAGDGSPRETLRRILITPLILADEDAHFRAVQELMILKTAVSPDLADGMAQKVQGIRGFLGTLAEIAQVGIQAGELRQDVEPRDIAASLFAQQIGLLSLLLLDPASLRVKQQAERLADLFIDGISAR
jgi:TetR/AcrR family acrAB operon transcriptional repressor